MYVHNFWLGVVTKVSLRACLVGRDNDLQHSSEGAVNTDITLFQRVIHQKLVHVIGREGVQRVWVFQHSHLEVCSHPEKI